MKEDILRLKAEGKTNAQIRKILGCSNVIIYYHTDPKYKERHLNMQWNKRRAESAAKKAIPKNQKSPAQTKDKILKNKPMPKLKPLKPVKKKFETIPVDNTNKIAVKLDSKTTVHVLPGYDLEALRKKYLKK